MRAMLIVGGLTILVFRKEILWLLRLPWDLRRGRKLVRDHFDEWSCGQPVFLMGMIPYQEDARDERAIRLVIRWDGSIVSRHRRDEYRASPLALLGPWFWGPTLVE